MSQQEERKHQSPPNYNIPPKITFPPKTPKKQQSINKSPFESTTSSDEEVEFTVTVPINCVKKELIKRTTTTINYTKTTIKTYRITNTLTNSITFEQETLITYLH
eukprot:492242_1